jgi:DNA-binding NarL/FixJ family response regulator
MDGPPESSLRILVADDSAAFREGLAALLASVDGVVLAGEAADGDDAVAQALRLQPDVVLMDLNMPGRNGIDATRAVVSTAPHIAVLVLTMHEDDASFFSAVQAGARGYVVKGARQAELVRSIRIVADGGGVFGPAIAEQLVLSTKTVRNHVSSIFTKIHVADRAQAIVKAREAGIGGR